MPAHDPYNFKFQLNTYVYWINDNQPQRGRIIRRGYQETWHDDLDDVGGYTVNNFYEAASYYGKQIFHESDFGKKCFTDPTEFADFITQPK